MNIKERLTCKYCNNIYNDPITLTCCGDHLCKQHIEELTSTNSPNRFKCPLCDEENPKQNFNVNKLIRDLLESNLHKFDVDSKFKIIFDSLKTEIHNLEAVLTDPENIIYMEIRDLKRQVNLDRENLISQIDKQANDLIQQLESYETRFKAEYKKNVDLHHYTFLVESSSINPMCMSG
jgi:DNA repair exonuclease SbcCD ATPase subunit